MKKQPDMYDFMKFCSIPEKTHPKFEGLAMIILLFSYFSSGIMINFLNMLSDRGELNLLTAIVLSFIVVIVYILATFAYTEYCECKIKPDIMGIQLYGPYSTFRGLDYLMSDNPNIVITVLLLIFGVIVTVGFVVSVILDRR